MRCRAKLVFALFISIMQLARQYGRIGNVNICGWLLQTGTTPRTESETSATNNVVPSEVTRTSVMISLPHNCVWVLDWRSSPMFQFPLVKTWQKEWVDWLTRGILWCSPCCIQTKRKDQYSWSAGRPWSWLAHGQVCHIHYLYHHAAFQNWNHTVRELVQIFRKSIIWEVMTQDWTWKVLGDGRRYANPRTLPLEQSTLHGDLYMLPYHCSVCPVPPQH